MEKYRETKYYITFDIETMEELISPKLNKKNKVKGKQTRRWNIMLFNPNNEEKEAIIAFHNKYFKHMVVYLEKGSDIVDPYLKENFILNQSQKVNWIKKNLNSRAKHSIPNDYPNEIRKFLINNLLLFIDDGNLNKLQNIQAYIPSSTSNNNYYYNNSNEND
jgi:hypothetical protein